MLQGQQREQFLPCHEWEVFPLKSKDLLCWFSPGLISVHNPRDRYLCLCSFKLQQLMDYSRTQTQPDQAALVLHLFTISTSFAPLGCCVWRPSAEFCTGELAGVEATLDIEVMVTFEPMGMGQPWSVSVQAPHMPGLAPSTVHPSHGHRRAKAGWASRGAKLRRDPTVYLLTTLNCPCSRHGMSFFCFVAQQVFFWCLVINNTSLQDDLLLNNWRYCQGFWIIICFLKGSFCSLDVSCSKIPWQIVSFCFCGMERFWAWVSPIPGMKRRESHQCFLRACRKTVEVMSFTQYFPKQVSP